MDSKVSSRRSEPMFLVAATGMTGADGAGGYGGLQRVAHLLLGEFAALQVLLEQGVVGFGHTVYERLTSLRGCIGEIVGDRAFGAFAGRARVRVGLHGDQVDYCP